jgi:hypothetical protein
VGPDGALWFTEATGNQIGRITVAGTITEFPLPTAGSQPKGIAAGPDGNLWFTELAGNHIGRITTPGIITEFPVPTAGSQPLAIAPGPDGALAFTESAPAANQIGLVLDANHSFVQALYQDALGRSGSLAELDQWVTVLVNFGARPVAEGIERSPEARTRLVNSWYERFLGRAAMAGEEQWWVSALLRGATEEEVLSQILSSPEFFSGFTTVQAFINALYMKLLGRIGIVSAPEIQVWLPLPDSPLARAAVAFDFLTSTEYRTTVIQSYYGTLLHRASPPSKAEMAGWLASGLDLTRLRLGFEISQEFFLNG